MTQTILCAACGSRRQLRPGVCAYFCDEIPAGFTGTPATANSSSVTTGLHNWRVPICLIRV